MIPIYLESLDPYRREVFLKLKFLSKAGTLAGGTALTLQINHRHSFDFDIFFDKPNVEIYLEKLEQIFGIKETRTNLPNHQTFFTKNNIQITLFYYKFKPLYPKIITNSLPLFNLKDIAADKAYTIGRRPMWRDYVDTFFLFKKKHISLKNMINNANHKFKYLFDEKLFLEQLTYFGDIRSFDIKFIGKTYSTKAIQTFLKNEAMVYTNKYYK